MGAIAFIVFCIVVFWAIFKVGGGGDNDWMADGGME